MTEYTESFYDDQSHASYISATKVLPIIFKHIKPRSVLDLGCGLGTWLKACGELGVKDFYGVDGSYVNKEKLWISKDRFISANLSEKLYLHRRFDMAFSMEVAEHIDSNSAKLFVNNLTDHSDVILFSAAIPYQGGTGHVNENWPEFWAIHFQKNGYKPIDFIRPKVWHDPEISFWYKQNTILYIKEERINKLGFEHYKARSFPLTVIHPDMYLWACMRSENHHHSNYIRDREYYASLHSAQDSTDEPPKNINYGSEYQVDFKPRFYFLRKLDQLFKRWTR
ncbi:methyltransferase domain-containing protein [Salinisphaera sp. G21_0]|uniref:class I SAM-dependent methyltransferase n=1 Tax=Salinisphaera sp. G21_0 TaxID=2821094 RepID=UPI001ADB911E|nr:methyltransferase domain-containing protein [Salinisphaera sp. G21_0]MBO9484009.1 methyltransferase domain-containing protein [Salinisphaera sp. G21_0]